MCATPSATSTSRPACRNMCVYADAHMHSMLLADLEPEVGLEVRRATPSLLHTPTPTPRGGGSSLLVSASASSRVPTTRIRRRMASPHATCAATGGQHSSGAMPATATGAAWVIVARMHALPAHETGVARPHVLRRLQLTFWTSPSWGSHLGATTHRSGAWRAAA